MSIPNYFEISTKEYHLNDNQKNILINSFKELHPYLESYYIMYQFCPKTKLNHVSIVFNFNENKYLDLSLLSDETLNKWKLNNMQSVLNKNKEDVWREGCIMRFGIPPIQRCLPKDLIKEIFGNKSEEYHLEASHYCYKN